MGSTFKITEKQSKPELKALRDKFDAGELNATFPILAISFVGDVDVGYDFEREQLVWNQKLGLPKVTLDEVVKEAVEFANRS